ncbi:MAG: hypothetical protein AUJ82_07050 [Verrucomicrobia bacterium CG1_02_43_26]|nr:MAG: hypothetical protein AUJ82_07050 [Verrucomicrobia bacterium CG1_02_43_26]
MEVVSSTLFPNKDKASLEAFLRYCHSVALQKNNFQLVSISLQVPHIDPLLVLASIHEKNALHCYIEHPEEGKATIGAESALSATFASKDRFAKVKAFAENIIENTIAFGDLTAAFTGPHFFTAFTFFDDLESRKENSFAPATVFVPLWQASKTPDSCSVVVNIVVDKDSDIPQLVEKVWAAHKKLSAMNQDTFPLAVPEQAEVFQPEEVGGEAYFENAVRTAIIDIEKAKYSKIVLARAVDLKPKKPFNPLVSLNRLRKNFTNCYTLSFSNEQGKNFIAATPEKLLTVSDNEFTTHALAGSAPRGKTGVEDEAYGIALLNSKKDIHEHQLVVDAILQNLANINVSAEKSEQPVLLKLRNVQHIKTSISAYLINGQHILDLVSALHPTPAVGGTPVDVARNSIKEIENFDRGLYAGVIGWFDYKNNGQMLVAIRSALMEEHRARLFAGAGIVQGSDPYKEKAETDMKLQALLLNI